MRVLFPICMMGLLLAGFGMGDKMPLLNAWELIRESGASFLPESGTRFIADQEKFGGSAVLVAWAAWIVASAVLAHLTAKILQLLK